MKNSVLTVTLLGLISFGAFAGQSTYRDDNDTDRYAKELRLKAFEGQSSYQVTVSPLLLVDREEPVSTRHATELRKQAVNVPVRSVEPSVRYDRDEPVSTRHATELRKQAL